MSNGRIKNDIRVLTGPRSPAGTVIPIGGSLLSSGNVGAIPTLDTNRYDLSAQVGGIIDVMDKILIEQTISRGGDPLLLRGAGGRGLSFHPDIRLKLRTSSARMILSSHRGGRRIQIAGRPNVEALIRYKLDSLRLKGLGWLLPNTATRGSKAMLSVAHSIPAFVSTYLKRDASGRGFVFASGQMTPILPAYRGLLTGSGTSNEAILCTARPRSTALRQCIKNARSRNIEAPMVRRMLDWAKRRNIRPEYFGIQLFAAGARGRRVAFLTGPSVSPVRRITMGPNKFHIELQHRGARDLMGGLMVQGAAPAIKELTPTLVNSLGGLLGAAGVDIGRVPLWPSLTSANVQMAPRPRVKFSRSPLLRGARVHFRMGGCKNNSRPMYLTSRRSAALHFQTRACPNLSSTNVATLPIEMKIRMNQNPGRRGDIAIDYAHLRANSLGGLTAPLKTIAGRFLGLKCFSMDKRRSRLDLVFNGYVRKQGNGKRIAMTVDIGPQSTFVVNAPVLVFGQSGYITTKQLVIRAADPTQPMISYSISNDYPDGKTRVFIHSINMKVVTKLGIPRSRTGGVKRFSHGVFDLTRGVKKILPSWGVTSARLELGTTDPQRHYHPTITTSIRVNPRRMRVNLLTENLSTVLDVRGRSGVRVEAGLHRGDFFLDYDIRNRSLTLGQAGRGRSLTSLALKVTNFRTGNPMLDWLLKKLTFRGTTRVSSFKIKLNSNQVRQATDTRGQIDLGKLINTWVAADRNSPFIKLVQTRRTSFSSSGGVSGHAHRGFTTTLKRDAIGMILGGLLSGKKISLPNITANETPMPAGYQVRPAPRSVNLQTNLGINPVEPTKYAERAYSLNNGQGWGIGNGNWGVGLGTNFRGLNARFYLNWGSNGLLSALAKKYLRWDGIYLNYTTTATRLNQEEATRTGNRTEWQHALGLGINAANLPFVDLRLKAKISDGMDFELAPGYEFGFDVGVSPRVFLDLYITPMLRLDFLYDSGSIGLRAGWRFSKTVAGSREGQNQAFWLNAVLKF